MSQSDLVAYSYSVNVGVINAFKYEGARARSA